ncbi:MAG: hypothetical protein HYY16_05195 [Planctomycetes bacterium]|nr:hypothetical protein [Planctomycetota bacterium]
MLDVNATVFSAWLREAERCRARGDLRGAVRHYTKVIEVHPRCDEAYMGRAEARARLARKARSRRDLVRALSDADTAVDLAPTAPRYRIARAELRRLYQDDPKGAIEDYTRAIELDPLDARAFEGRAYAYEALAADPQRARTCLEAAALDAAEALRLAQSSVARRRLAALLRRVKG